MAPERCVADLEESEGKQDGRDTMVMAKPRNLLCPPQGAQGHVTRSGQNIEIHFVPQKGLQYNVKPAAPRRFKTIKSFAKHSRDNVVGLLSHSAFKKNMWD